MTVLVGSFSNDFTNVSITLIGLVPPFLYIICSNI